MKKKLNWSIRARIASGCAFVAASACTAVAAIPTAYTDAVDDTVADVSSFGSSTYVALGGAAVVFVLGGIFLRMIFKGRSVAK